jgi:hypothetical protein
VANSKGELGHRPSKVGADDVRKHGGTYGQTDGEFVVLRR